MAFRNKMSIVCICFALMVTACDAPSSTGGSLAFASLDSEATIGDAKAKLGDYKPGHGPYVWFRHPDGEKRTYEAWFIPNDNISNVEDVRISFIFEVDRRGPSDVVLVVWPPELKGKDPKNVMKMTYGDSVRIR